MPTSNHATDQTWPDFAVEVGAAVLAQRGGLGDEELGPFADQLRGDVAAILHACIPLLHHQVTSLTAAAGRDAATIKHLQDLAEARRQAAEHTLTVVRDELHDAHALIEQLLVPERERRAAAARDGFPPADQGRADKWRRDNGLTPPAPRKDTAT